MTLIITESNKSGIMKNITTRISRVVFVTLCLLAMATMAQANAGSVLPTSLTLYEGESKVISAPDVARMSVGKQNY
jgi:hypothetical protein